MAELKTMVVLGMHRSATSMTARALHRAGECWMGHKLLLGADGNADGHFEHCPTADLSNAILKAAGGSWQSPPSREAILAVGPQFSESIECEIRALENGRPEGVHTVGFKDPRLCLTVELFHPHLRNPHYIVHFRDPREVAKSLLTRDGTPAEDGERLAHEYNRRALDFLKKHYLGPQT